MKNIVFFDLDNTIIKGYTQFFLIRYLHKKKKINTFFILRVYFWFILYKTRFVNNPRKIMEKSFLFISGWSVDAMECMLEEFYNEILYSNLNKLVQNKIKYHLKNNDEIYLISSAAYPLVKKVAEKIGINKVYATKLEILNGHYTGSIDGNIVYGEEKSLIGKKILKKVPYGYSYCYADHISDMPLFEIVDKKIVVCPKRSFLKIINNKWLIIPC